VILNLQDLPLQNTLRGKGHITMEVFPFELAKYLPSATACSKLGAFYFIALLAGLIYHISIDKPKK